MVVSKEERQKSSIKKCRVEAKECPRLPISHICSRRVFMNYCSASFLADYLCR